MMNQRTLLTTIWLAACTIGLATITDSVIAQGDQVKPKESIQDSKQLEDEMIKSLNELTKLSAKIHKVLAEKESHFQVRTFRQSVVDMKSLLERAEQATDPIEIDSIWSKLKQHQADIKSIRYELAKRAVNQKRLAEQKKARLKAKERYVPNAIHLLKEAGLSQKSVLEIQRIIDRDLKNEKKD